MRVLVAASKGLEVNRCELEILLQHPTGSVLRSVLDAAPVAASLGMDGQIVYANPECARMWGFEHPTQMKGLSFFSLIAADWHPFVTALWRSRHQGTSAWTYELEGVHRDGTRFAYRCTSLSFETASQKATFAYFTELDSCLPLEEQMRNLEQGAGGFEPREP